MPTQSLDNGTVGVAYNATLSAAGGPLPYTWSLASGSLPPGLAPSTSGTISGTPTTAGSYTFTIQASDSGGQKASRAFTVSITSSTPTLAIASPTNGATVSGTITVSGTASDIVGVSAVQVQVDGGAFSPASGTNNWTFILNTGSLSNAAHTITPPAT